MGGYAIIFIEGGDIMFFKRKKPFVPLTEDTAASVKNSSIQDVRNQHLQNIKQHIAQNQSTQNSSTNQSNH